MRRYFKRINSKSREIDSRSPVGELHIQCSISLVPDHIVEGLPRAFRVRQGEVAPRINFNEVKTFFPQPVGNACCRDGFRAPGYNCQRIVLEVVVPGFSGEILLVIQDAAGVLPHQFYHGLFVHHCILVPCHNKSPWSLVVGEPASVSEKSFLTFLEAGS